MAKVLKIASRSEMDWDEALDDYLMFKKAQGLRDITVKGHRDVMGLFLKRHPEVRLGRVREAVYAFMGEDIKPATYNIRRNYMRQFFEWAVQRRLLDENPMLGLKKRHDDGRLASLDIDGLRRLLDLPDRSTFAGLRDYALMCFMLDTGARPKECFELKVADFNFRAMEVRVTAGVAKTGSARTLPMSAITARAVKTLIGCRHEQWGADVPAFCSAAGTPFRNDTWGDRLERYGKELGIKVYPYMLRHTFATQFLRNGGNALTLQRIMGHSTLEMTKRYVHLTQADVKAGHQEASPISAAAKRNRLGRIR